MTHSDALARTFSGALVLLTIFMVGLLVYQLSQASIGELVGFAKALSAIPLIILVSYAIGTLISEAGE